MNRILVALDSSPRAPLVLSSASQLAAPMNSKLILFRAVTVPPDIPAHLLTASGTRLEDLLIREADTELAQLAKDLPPGRVEKTLSVFSVPWDGICRIAREQAADLIAIGSHGYGGLDRILGTTASKVVNHASCNVLVIRTAL